MSKCVGELWGRNINSTTDENYKENYKKIDWSGIRSLEDKGDKNDKDKLKPEAKEIC